MIDDRKIHEIGDEYNGYTVTSVDMLKTDSPAFKHEILPLFSGDGELSKFKHRIKTRITEFPVRGVSKEEIIGTDFAMRILNVVNPNHFDSDLIIADIDELEQLPKERRFVVFYPHSQYSKDPSIRSILLEDIEQMNSANIELQPQICIPACARLILAREINGTDILNVYNLLSNPQKIGIIKELDKISSAEEAVDSEIRTAAEKLAFRLSDILTV